MLEFRRQNLFECGDLISETDVVICELMIPPATFPKYVELLERAKKGARLLTLLELENIYQHSSESKVAWKLITRDWFETTWNPSANKKGGGPLEIWRKDK